MNSHGSASLAMADLSAVGQRARRRVAYRLLPFVFVLYIVNYVDRVNVSFANLRMSADLGFSDRVYGLGVGMSRIMISWGIVTILTGFVHTATQFYAARFFFGGC